MQTVFVINGEHPYDPYYPQEVFTADAERAANARAAELTREFLADMWKIEHEDTPLIQAPDVTADNWRTIVAEHGSDGDADGFGRWYIVLSELELKGSEGVAE